MIYYILYCIKYIHFDNIYTFPYKLHAEKSSGNHVNPNVDYYYTFSIDLKPNGIHFGAKSTGKG